MKRHWNDFDDDEMDEVGDDFRKTEDPNNSEELVHYGILGMKWGVRRTPEQLGHKTTTTKKTKYKIVAKSPFEKKMDRLAKKEQKISEKETIKAKKDELRFRKAELTNKSEKDAAKAKRAAKKAEEKAKRAEEKANEKEAKNKAKEAEAKAKKQTNVPKNRDVKSISDEELSQILRRYDMEKKYKQMVAESSQNGKSWLTKTLLDIGQETAKVYLKKGVASAIESAIAKAKKNNERPPEDLSGMTDEQLRDYVNRRNLEEQYRRYRNGG